MEKATTFIRPRIELPRLRPLDTIKTTVNGEEIGVPALAFRQQLDALPTTEVLARYADGTPAATSNRFARGQAILWGTLAGDGVRAERASRTRCRRRTGGRSRTRRSRSFGATCAQLIVGPALPFARRGAECSEPLVETGLLETDRAILVPLACLLDGPRQVDLTIHDVGPATRVWAVRAGPLPLTQDGNARADVADAGPDGLRGGGAVGGEETGDRIQKTGEAGEPDRARDLAWRKRVQSWRNVVPA